MTVWMSVINQLPKRPRAITTKGVARKSSPHVERRAWSDDDLEFLERNYPIMGNQEISQQLKRAKTSVRVQANSMGLKKIFSRNKPPGNLYREVIERVKDGQSHAMIIMTLFVTQEEIDACIRHRAAHGA